MSVAPTPADRAAISWRIRPIVLVLIVATVPYLQTLGHSFAFDDRAEIVENRLIRSFRQLPEIFTNTALAGAGLDNQLYRPLTTLSFALNYSVSGLEPWSYHLVNLLLHALVCMLVFRVLRGWPLGPGRAVLASLIFAVHPIHVEAVANIAGRKELLMALFALATLLLHRRSMKLGGIAAVLAPLSYLAAMLSKETGAIAPGFIVLEDLWLRRKVPAGTDWRQVRLRYLSLLLVMVLYLAVRWQVVGTFGVEPISRLDNPAAHASVATRIQTAIAVIGLGWWLQVIPQQLSPDYSFNAIPLAQGWLDWRVVTTLAMAAGTIIVALRAGSRRHALLLCLGMYGLALLPGANLLLPIGTIFGERLLYLPSAAFCVFVAVLLPGTSDLGRHRFTTGAAAAALVVLGVLTAFYAAAWKNDSTLFSLAIKRQPNSAKVQYNYGLVQAAQGNLQDAYRAYSEAIQIDSQYQRPYLNRGNLRIDLGDLDGAIADFNYALKLQPFDALAWNSRGLALRLAGQAEAARQDFTKALEIDPNYGEALVNRGLSHQMLKDLDAARADYETALRVTPSNWKHRSMVEKLIAELPVSSSE